MKQKKILAAIAVLLLGALPGSVEAKALEYTENNDYIYYETPYLEQSTVYLAKGGAVVMLSINNGTLLSAISSNPSIASVTAEGAILPGEAGQTELTVLVTDNQGIVQTLYCTVYVTEYRLSQTEVRLSMNQSPQTTIYLQGMVYEYGYEGLETEVVITDSSVAEAYLSWDNSITSYGKKAGKTSLQALRRP